MDKLKIILDLANNHIGSVEKGKQIITELSEVVKDFPFEFIFKFQYRQLNSFIHPDYQDDVTHKYIKRFKETELKPNQYLELVNYAKEKGFEVGLHLHTEEGGFRVGGKALKRDENGLWALILKNK